MRQLRRDELRFDVHEGGPPGGDPVVLLHGFPQPAWSWDGVASRLHGAGYRTLALDQRGYSPGARPVGVDPYRIDTLAGDVLALADDAGLERFHLVGHDWGAMVAWYVAAHHPRRLRSVASLSTPHPRALVRSLGRSAQALRSSYGAAWLVRRLPERVMLARRAAPLRRALAGSGMPAASVERTVDGLLVPGALTAALNWYRAVPRARRLFSQLPDVTVPTLYIWSTGDPALGRVAAEATARFVSGPYRFEVLEGAPHWLPDVEPDRCADLLIEHARSASA